MADVARGHGVDLQDLSAGTAEEYADRVAHLAATVDEIMAGQEDVEDLIGGNPLKMMRENHRHHARFMATVLTLRDGHLLACTMPWVFRTYMNRGFAPEYFPRVLSAFCQAVDIHLSPAAARSARSVYRWMSENYERFLRESRCAPDDDLPESAVWADLLAAFLRALLRGDHQECLRLAEDSVPSAADVPDFYLQVIGPALLEIGERWEQNRISVTDEHLASSIVSRVMTSFHLRFMRGEYSWGRAVVTAVADEYHEIGARMVADLLEFDGWDVTFLGADTPSEELKRMLRRHPPFFLGLSVTMPFNVDRVRRLIGEIRGHEELDDMYIAVGGQVFSRHPHLVQVVDADAVATDGSEAVRIARAWWEGAQCDEAQ